MESQLKVNFLVFIDFAFQKFEEESFILIRKVGLN